MSGEEVHIVVHGSRRAEANSAAYATIRALEAAGASVGLSNVLPLSDLSGDALRGVRVTVGVQEGAVAVVAPTLAPDALPRTRAGAGARPAMAVIGAVVLLGLVSVELRLRFGLGALITVGIGGWAIWWTCFRRPE